MTSMGRTSRRHPLALGVTLVLAAGSLAACGGSDDGPTPGGSGGADSPSETLGERTWILDGTGSTPAISAGATVTLVHDSGNVSGQAPCNTYRTEFTVDGDRVEVGPIATTRMACESKVTEAETDFLKALERVDTVAANGDRLTLAGPDGVELIFDAQDLATALVGSWEIVNLATDDALATPLKGTTPTIDFADDGSLAANAGCNQIGATWELDGSSLSIGESRQTLMACDDPPGVMDQEAALAAALAAATRVEVSDQLTIFKSEGSMLIVAKRAADG
jgi:heat shock protein HslJ